MSRHRLVIAAPAAALVLIAACGESSADEPPPGDAIAPSAGTDGTSSPNASASGPTTTGLDAEASVTEGTPIRIRIGDSVLDGRLWDNPTAQDLIAQLPLTLEFRDLNSVEKIAELPQELTMDGVPSGDDPEPQDIGYYAPSIDLVFYYGDVDYYDCIVRLGVFDSDMDVIRSRTGPFTATVELAN